VEVGKIKIAAWIETAKSIVNVFEIASASPRISAIAFGADDYTLDMGIVRSEQGIELIYPRTITAIAGMAAGVIPLDTPYVNFRDEAGLIEDTKWSRQMGFKGRCLIHPSQVEPVNRLFTPSPEEVEHARRVLAAFQEAEARGSAATSVDGKLVDVPVAERAKRLLELAEAIAQKETLAASGEQPRP
jgi:citrate lyase subunit beta/citryl-CoA lyase